MTIWPEFSFEQTQKKRKLKQSQKIKFSKFFHELSFQFHDMLYAEGMFISRRRIRNTIFWQRDIKIFHVREVDQQKQVQIKRGFWHSPGYLFALH